jgi:tetratricopeptide (TPR) repeat protein
MLLRLTQHELDAGRHRVGLAWEGEGARRTAEATVAFTPNRQDEEDVRWYLEDFLQYPQDPAPEIARRIERRMAEVGEELFRAVFQGSAEVRDLWDELRRHLPEARIEIVTGVAAANTLPWELLRDPQTRELALAARSFVRIQPRLEVPPRLAATAADHRGGPVRILAVICRPSGALGGRDVPFRSVASRLIKGLDAPTRALYDLDLLRPPTFEQLGRALRRAQEEGKPYHAVHFDGHGAFHDFETQTGRPGRHGYVAFESPERPNNRELIDGRRLGRLLYEAAVPVLVLNSCHSARGEPAPAPAVMPAGDVSSEVDAFGSLAQEVMDAGVGGVVAMRHLVYVVTAAQLVAELYTALARGRTLGEAVTLARRNLADQPEREVASGRWDLQDWSVPVVYEAVPLRLFPSVAPGIEEIEPAVPLAEAATVAAPESGSSLPPPPDAGFYGRDETLLALDRAFDRDGIVLLHAYAGSGKTTTAAEFARWYAKTGGVDGPVLWSSFEHLLPLPRLLDRIGQVFEPELERAGIPWPALADERRRATALQLLTEKPVLWIWDNVEPVAGFPAGTTSAWSEEEQTELAHFLRALRETRTRVLLTSRRDERGWLGGLPTRVRMPPMPRLERFQLARALAERQGRRLAEVEDWDPLLAFTEGNPLTVTVLVGQALREGFQSRAQIEAFVERLRAGEAAFDDEAEEGRSRSLGASLAYGFENAFSEEERRRLALLALFQGPADVNVLQWMGDLQEPWCLAEAQGVGEEAWIALLDRAADIGLLAARGGGAYRIHPALPWFFRGLLETSFPQGDLAPIGTYAAAMGSLAAYCHRQYEQGNCDVIGVLEEEELNLLHAHRLARKHGWWWPVTSTLQGLRALYEHTGRRREWRRLVEEIVPDFVDPASEGPVEGREENWSLVMGYRVRLTLEERRWAEAERLQTLIMEQESQRVEGSLATPDAELDTLKKHRLRNLAVSFDLLGFTRRELGRADCVSAHEEALKLFERIGDRGGAAASAVCLGHAYLFHADLRDLDRAQRWYERAVELYGAEDRLRRGRCAGHLGVVARERSEDARRAGGSLEESLAPLREAARRNHQALELLPPDSVVDRALAHNQLGAIYSSTGDLVRSLEHFRKSIELKDAYGDRHAGAVARFNVAFTLLNAGRREDAMAYAMAALLRFESFGERTEGEVQRTQQLMAKIRG